ATSPATQFRRTDPRGTTVDAGGDRRRQTEVARASRSCRRETSHTRGRRTQPPSVAIHVCCLINATVASTLGLPLILRGGLREISRSRFSIEEALDDPAGPGVQAEVEGSGRASAVGVPVSARRSGLGAAAGRRVRDARGGGEGAPQGARPARAGKR